MSHPRWHSPEEGGLPPAPRGAASWETDRRWQDTSPAAARDTAPDLVRLTDDVLFGEVWADPGLSPRDRSLVTVAALVSLYRADRSARTCAGRWTTA